MVGPSEEEVFSLPKGLAALNEGADLVDQDQRELDQEHAWVFGESR